MVKKKTRRKVIKPPQPKLDTVFNCYKCGTKKTIEVKYNRKEKIATLRCKACGIKFETNIRPADAYIDIYYRWIDHIQEEEENKNSDEESKNKSDSEEKEYDDNDEEEKEEAEDEIEKEEKEEKSDNEEENENDNEEKEEKDDKDDKDDEGSEKDKDDE